VAVTITEWRIPGSAEAAGTGRAVAWAYTLFVRQKNRGWPGPGLTRRRTSARPGRAVGHYRLDLVVLPGLR